MFDLSGRNALVTGASGSIGSAIARAIAGQGARVALSGRREDALKVLADEIGGNVAVVPGDLSRGEDVERLAEAAQEALGGIDILIHNAGVTRDGLSVRMSDDDWTQVLTVNLESGFRLIRSSLRGMMRRRWGRIIGISSIVAATGNPGQLNYAASKAGMIGMMKALAHEVAVRGITANCVAPGFIESDMVVELPQERRTAIVGAIPMGRVGTPEDVAASVAYLASEEAAYVTGQTLHVNGGMAMI